MDYKVTWHEEALKDLRGLGRATQRAVVDKTHLVKDPLSVGKPLKREFKGLYRMRFEDYRIIYAIDREEMKVMIARVRHRKEAYR